VFLDDISIKNLNKMYRNVDSTTDVLSFHYFDDFSFLSKNDIAGEIVMSENKIIFQ
jgi:ssRNA-specific RNase YbeY (16S rRNA maturation enzyme)